MTSPRTWRRFGAGPCRLEVQARTTFLFARAVGAVPSHHQHHLTLTMSSNIQRTPILPSGQPLHVVISIACSLLLHWQCWRDRVELCLDDSSKPTASEFSDENHQLWYKTRSIRALLCAVSSLRRVTVPALYHDVSEHCPHADFNLD